MSEHDKDFATVARLKFSAFQKAVAAWTEESGQPLLKKLSVGKLKRT
jgi:hypothetical protein